MPQRERYILRSRKLFRAFVAPRRAGASAQEDLMAVTRAPAKAKKPRHETLGLAARDLLRMYETMLLARSLDERMWLLQRQGKAAFLVSCQGHEAAQIASAAALQPGTDVVLPYYRDLGIVLWMGMTPREIMLNLMARADDPNGGGKQM